MSFLYRLTGITKQGNYRSTTSWCNICNFTKDQLTHRIGGGGGVTGIKQQIPAFLPS